jgi:hypothetical protein
MGAGQKIQASMIIAFLLVPCLLTGSAESNSHAQSNDHAQSNGYGPEVKSFLDLMRHEEGELEFQIQRKEITRREYIRSKNRIAIHRQTILNMAKETGEDYVPELHVVAATELDQLIEDGAKALRAIKRGEVIKNKWRYLGSVTKGEVFYIFERVKSN